MDDYTMISRNVMKVLRREKIDCKRYDVVLKRVFDGNDVIIKNSDTPNEALLCVVALEVVLKKLDRLPKVLIVCSCRKSVYSLVDYIKMFGKRIKNLKVKYFSRDNEVDADIMVGTLLDFIGVIDDGRVKELETTKLVIFNDIENYNFTFDNSVMDLLSIRSSLQLVAISNSYESQYFSKIRKLMKEPFLVPVDSKRDALERIRMFHLKIQSNNTEKKKIRGILKIFRCISFNRAIIFTGDKRFSRIISTELIKNDWRVMNVDETDSSQENSTINDSHRIIIAESSNSISSLPQDITLSIHSNIPPLQSVLEDDITLMGRKGYLSMSISLGTKTEIVLLRTYCSNMAKPLMALPARIDPAYFFMDDLIPCTISSIVESAKSIEIEKFSDAPSKIQHPKILSDGMINSNSPYIDLTNDTIEGFTAVDDVNESLWYEEETKRLGQLGFRNEAEINNLTPEETEKRIAYFLKRLQLPNKFLPKMECLMETESWSYPINQTVKEKVDAWVETVKNPRVLKKIFETEALPDLIMEEKPIPEISKHEKEKISQAIDTVKSSKIIEPPRNIIKETPKVLKISQSNRQTLYVYTPNSNSNSDIKAEDVYSPQIYDTKSTSLFRPKKNTTSKPDDLKFNIIFPQNQN